MVSTKYVAYLGIYYFLIVNHNLLKVIKIGYHRVISNNQIIIITYTLKVQINVVKANEERNYPDRNGVS